MKNIKLKIIQKDKNYDNMSNIIYIYYKNYTIYF